VGVPGSARAALNNKANDSSTGSLRRWQLIGSGEFHRWEREGDSLEGIWLGSHEGPYGLLGSLDTLRGRLTFPLHAVLRQRLIELKEGTEVRIVYRGTGSTKKGWVVKLFDVFVAGDEGTIS
jgi:hypothetical protein